MKVLHISFWHPNRENPYEAIWVKRHIDALGAFCEQEVWHIEVRPGRKFKYQKYSESGCNHRILDIPFRQWIFVEIISDFMLWRLLSSIKKKKFDLINFHIAYPLLSFWNYIKGSTKQSIVITEHWSAYHLNFGLPKDSKKLGRIKNIFKQGFSLITVSQALLNDIREFSGTEQKRGIVIPNIVNTEVFKPANEKNNSADQIHFFMVSGWAFPKDPVTVIKAFAELLKKHQNIFLEIGGYGVLMSEMTDIVEKLQIASNVRFLGKMSPEEIAAQHQKSSAYLHCSGYETFSVVCAEALCSGVPVIASDVGGIPEFLSSENGILVESNSIIAWTDALNNFINKHTFDSALIAANAAAQFDSKVVGKKYFETLSGILDETKK